VNETVKVQVREVRKDEMVTSPDHESIRHDFDRSAHKNLESVAIEDVTG
jgi:hypothetical protein